ncbi:MAG TPA: IS66 family transposase [Pirellulaceae bacterium]|nr:IS66 family transposase [Pirellulaceae bacterium]
MIEAPPGQLVCEKHGARKPIGYDKVETLVHKRPELYVLERQYPKHTCPGCAACGVATPPRPTGLVAGNRIDTSVGATVVTGKWWYHLPLYRLQDYFAALGWQPSRSTLNNVVKAVDFALQPLYALQKRLVQADCVVSFDDTTCRMLVSDLRPEDETETLRKKVAEMRNRHRNSILAHMWVYSGRCRAPYDVFDFQVSRNGSGPADFFQTTTGVAVGDCYSGNLSYIVRNADRLRLAACWAHVRRKLVECDTYVKQCDELLELINALYDVETRGTPMTPEARRELRRRESRIILDGIQARLSGSDYDDLLKSDFKTAAGYIQNHWTALNVFVDDGLVPIDNNLAEGLMKRVAMGRKAWLFVNGPEGGRRSARLMSIVASAHRHDLDVETYLKDVLDRLLAGSTDYTSMLPDVWKQTHPTALRTYRETERQQKAERKQARAAVRRLAHAR